MQKQGRSAAGGSGIGVGRVAKPPLLLVQVGYQRAQVLRAQVRPGGLKM